ncbi:MAG: sulfatase/phosphatase domain-containing protein, partial [Planctomycetota bacterium]
PNVRGVRTDRFKYVHYPNGDNKPDQYKAELYDLLNDPLEKNNLIDNPKYARKVKELKAELRRLMAEAGALPDKMPLYMGIKAELPDEKIR